MTQASHWRFRLRRRTSLRDGNEPLTRPPLVRRRLDGTRTDRCRAAEGRAGSDDADGRRPDDAHEQRPPDVERWEGQEGPSRLARVRNAEAPAGRRRPRVLDLG